MRTVQAIALLLLATLTLAQTEQDALRIRDLRSRAGQSVVVKGRSGQIVEASERPGVRVYTLRDDYGDVVNVHTRDTYPVFGTTVVVTGTPVIESGTGGLYLDEQSREMAYPPGASLRKVLLIVVPLVLVGIIVAWVLVSRRSGEGLPAAWGYAEAVSGPHQGKSFALRGPEVVVGRGQDALLAVDLPLDDSVSRQHGRIVRDGEAVYFEDTGSSFGSWVNEQQVQSGQRVQLAPGALIRLGPSTIIRVGQAGAATAGATRFAGDENEGAGNVGESPTRRADA